MKILILSGPNPTMTSGTVALDVYSGLKKNSDNEVKMLVKDWNKFEDPDIISVETYLFHVKKSVSIFFMKLFTKLKLIKKSNPKVNPDYLVLDVDQTQTFYSTERILARIGFIPDIIIVLFIQRFISYKNLYELNIKTKAKTLMMLMDMAPYTSACSFSWECLGYQNKCGSCPALLSADKNDQSNINWSFKKKYISQTDVEIIASTEWQVSQIEKSSLFADKKKHKILLSINQDIFKPADKIRLRRAMGISPNKKVIFFGSVELKEKRKGMVHLIDSLKILRSMLTDADADNLILLIAGKGMVNMQDIYPFSIRYLGMLKSMSDLAQAYQVADLFVCSSIEDPGPTMINQSIMTGTPVVSFEMGVALDLVIPGKTGYRAELKNNEDLAKGMKYILDLDDLSYRQFGENCRALALKSFSQSVQIEKIMHLINNRE